MDWVYLFFLYQKSKSDCSYLGQETSGDFLTSKNEILVYEKNKISAPDKLI